MSRHSNGQRTWKDCQDSRNVEKFARQNNVEIIQGKGSHIKLKKGQYAETCYAGTMSVGVSRAVYKFFRAIKAVGFVLIPIIFLLVVFTLLEPAGMLAALLALLALL